MTSSLWLCLLTLMTRHCSKISAFVALSPSLSKQQPPKTIMVKRRQCEYYCSHNYHNPSAFFVLMVVTNNYSDDDNNGNNIGNEDDFYRDLQKAKSDKLGASIPPDQLRESSIQAENEFLEAMKETQKEFRKAKEKLGSDGAVDLFLNRIRSEDAREEEVNDIEDEAFQ